MMLGSTLSAGRCTTAATARTAEDVDCGSFIFHVHQEISGSIGFQQKDFCYDSIFEDSENSSTSRSGFHSFWE
jgi:hypothetical protein